MYSIGPQITNYTLLFHSIKSGNWDIVWRLGVFSIIEHSGRIENERKVLRKLVRSDFVSTFPEMSLKPDVYSKQETLNKQEVVQNPEIPVKQEMAAAQRRRVDGYVGFANLPNQV